MSVCVYVLITTRGSLAQRGPFLLLLFFSHRGISPRRRENNSFKCISSAEPPDLSPSSLMDQLHAEHLFAQQKMLAAADGWTRALAAVPQSAVPRCAWGGGLDTAATRRHRGEPTPHPHLPPTHHTSHITPPRPVRLPPQHTPSPSVRGPALSQCEWLA